MKLAYILLIVIWFITLLLCISLFCINPREETEDEHDPYQGDKNEQRNRKN
jgi:hypothetical protein